MDITPCIPQDHTTLLVAGRCADRNKRIRQKLDTDALVQILIGSRAHLIEFYMDSTPAWNNHWQYCEHFRSQKHRRGRGINGTFLEPPNMISTLPTASNDPLRPTLRYAVQTSSTDSHYNLISSFEMSLRRLLL